MLEKKKKKIRGRLCSRVSGSHGNIFGCSGGIGQAMPRRQPPDEAASLQAAPLQPDDSPARDGNVPLQPLRALLSDERQRSDSSQAAFLRQLGDKLSRQVEELRFTAAMKLASFRSQIEAVTVSMEAVVLTLRK